MNDTNDSPQERVDDAHHTDNQRRFVAIERRLEDGDLSMRQIKDDLKVNTDATQRVEASTADIVEFFQSMQGAFKVLNWIGKLAKPIGAIIALFVALWTAWIAFKTGSSPK